MTTSTRYGIDLSGRDIWQVDPGSEFLCSECNEPLAHPATFTRGKEGDPTAIVCRYCRPFEYEEILYKGSMVRCRGSGRLMVENWPENPRGVQVVHPYHGDGFIERAAHADLVWVRFWGKEDRLARRGPRANTDIFRVSDLYRLDTVDQLIVDWLMDRIEKGLPLPPTRPHRLTVREAFLYHARGEWCDAWVVAIIEDEDRALLEYIAPDGSTALRIINRTVEANPDVHSVEWGKVRSVTYRNLPKKWLRAICLSRNIVWWGQPQGAGAWPGTPQETWEKRYPNEPLEV